MLPEHTDVCHKSGVLREVEHNPDGDGELRAGIWELMWCFGDRRVGEQGHNPSQVRTRRTVLRALVVNEKIWDGSNGNARLARMRVEIPHT